MTGGGGGGGVGIGGSSIYNIYINNSLVLVLKFKCSFELKESSEIFLRMESLS